MQTAPAVGTRVLTIDGCEVDSSTVVHSVKPRRGNDPKRRWLIEIADSGGVNTEEIFNESDMTFEVTP